MPRSLKAFAALLLIFIVVIGALIAWRVFRRGETVTAYALLTPMPGATGFEPQARPQGPVLRNTEPGSLAVGFSYRPGTETYRYALALSFLPGAEKGRAIVTAGRDGHVTSTDTEAVRRWDEPRRAYAIALSDKFMVEPPVPALCIKAVLGPDLGRFDLSDATLCVAQRDIGGACHPETLACGLLRP